MPAKPSGKIKTGIIRVTQENGDIYVYERQTLYDPDKHYNVSKGSKLIGKISKGKTEIEPTRPKRSARTASTDASDLSLQSRSLDDGKSRQITDGDMSGGLANISKDQNESHDQEQNQATSRLTARRTCVGMMDILEYIGDVSGIDAALYESMDSGTAQKVISMARYFIGTNGQSSPGVCTWQFAHKLPYSSGITESIYHELYSILGRDESAQQNFFKIRYSQLNPNMGIAYDSTTISTYSEMQKEACYGYNKDGDKLKTIKILALYSLDEMQPIAISKQSGNIPDVIAIKNAINELQAIGVETGEIVTDNGYYSNSNLAELLYSGFNFISLIKTNITWVKKVIDENNEALHSFTTVCEFDPSVHCITFKINRLFIRNENNLTKSDIENNSNKKFSKEIYLHIYFDYIKQAEDRHIFDCEIIDLKKDLEAKKISIDDLDEKLLKKATKFLNIVNEEDRIVVTIRGQNCNEAYKYHGYFALVADKEKSACECLKKYRKRNAIELFFKNEKYIANGKRPRVWDSFVLRGKIFVQFVALCYYEYYRKIVKSIISTLGVPNGDKQHDSKNNISKELKLKSWLENTPLYLQLQWFDVIENVEISSELRKKRWNSATISRDRLFLEKLGVDLTVDA